MRYITLLLVICVVAMKAPAQNRFGLFSYQVPDGFKLINSTDSVIVYSHADDGKNIFQLLVMLKATPSSGDAKSDFNKRWKIVTSQLGMGISPKSENTFTAGCYTVKEGSSEGMYRGLKCTLRLVTVTGYNSTASYYFFGNNHGYYQTAMDSYARSVSIYRPAGAKVQSCEKINPTYVFNTRTVDTAKQHAPVMIGAEKKTIPEIWMTMQINPSVTNIYSNIYSSSVNPKFYVVYENGDYYPDLPPEGLAAISNTNKQNDSWGLFAMNGNKGSFKSKYENLQVERISATQLKKTGYSFNFYKCTSVDGLKLEGAWSYIPNWTKDPYYAQPGCRQVIYFKKDGTFDDRGVFVSNCNQPNKDPQNAPGKGAYTISNFSILLTYNDGHTVQKAFTGVADKNPAVQNEVIYIGTNPFYIR